jgi:hypothetical protein
MNTTIYTPRFIKSWIFQCVLLGVFIIICAVNWETIMTGIKSEENVYTCGLIFVLLLVFYREIHEYAHKFAGEVFLKVKCKVIINSKNSVCIPKEPLKPFSFLVMILFPHLIQSIILFTFIILAKKLILLWIILIFLYITGSLGDIALFLQVFPLLNKKVQLKYKKSGVFSVISKKQ